MAPLPSLRLLLLPLLFSFSPYSSAIDFLFNSFSTSNATDLLLIRDAYFEPPVIRLNNDSNQYSYGRVFYPTKLKLKPTSNSTSISSFSTSFVFSILPDSASSPGFGFTFVLSNSTSPPGALASQYYGLFSNSHSIAPLIAVEFDTGQSPEFNDRDGNHIGIDLNSLESIEAHPAGYYDDSNNNQFVPVQMRNGKNIHVWIEFNGSSFEINVTLCPYGISKPSRPTLSFSNQILANYVSSEMYVGFSASEMTWDEAQRILAWSLSDIGVAREINSTNFPNFKAESSSSSLSPNAISGIVIACLVVLIIFGSGAYLFWWKKSLLEDNEEVEDWELEYWPHRFSFEELSGATDGFSSEQLLGSGGFGKVYKGTFPNNGTEFAVKCVNHDSKQGLREFMAEISSMGRLQHKNLVQMKGWCRKKTQLMLVYDYMPHGSLNRWIFDKPEKLLSWTQRRQVLADVAEGLTYLHHGWDQVVVHRDIKSSNVLLDSDMRARVGDFGLAKLYQHGEVPNTTRVVGTLGYLAPELATAAAPTAASDVFSFGVVVLEVSCGRRPIDLGLKEEEEVLIDWVRDLYVCGKVSEGGDKRIKGEYEVEEMEMVLKLGLACCHPDPQQRPSMKEVVAVLAGDRVAAPPTDLLSELRRGDNIRIQMENDSGDSSVDRNEVRSS